MTKIIKEVIPLTQNDCFTIFHREKNEFDFPLHFHPEYELNLILGAQGARRIVGEHMEEITDLELVLVGPNVSHVWTKHACRRSKITEVTIQWHANLFDKSFLYKHQLAFMRKMFELSMRGILFSKETIERIYPRILNIKKAQGFDAVLELMSILHELSISISQRILLESPSTPEQIATYKSRRVDKAYEFMHANFRQPITLNDVANVVSMHEVSFSRFLKKRTGISFIDSLNDIRLVHATRMLIETTHSIAEICYQCGFNNISNFNRLFKKKKQCTPKEFRKEYIGSRLYI
ncbi:AraC family transcriptional regulator [Sphingobacterium chungjuense]|uniref:AraC family transcriptional regulator n=1 Tax=Sphingobacterium chungjuense TaxID=2675553 RepID=UPI0014073556|nr:AraC family transcriptional regulator [Sphingobacterium chungjuense]